MKEKTADAIHWSFWVISSVMLVWNAMGVVNFFMQMNPEVLAAYRESERAIVEGRPAWATGAFAIGVFAGALGCLLLLFRKSAAYYLFIASLIGVLVTMIHTLTVGIDFSLGEILGIILSPVVVAVFLIWYAKYAEAKSWIGKKARQETAAPPI
jgi:type III secretory pathway component EscS|tara:strand:+ start:4123 stop:4584 length:462 start_codon:yes stop_codon:yes gene_type:complete